MKPLVCVLTFVLLMPLLEVSWAEESPECNYEGTQQQMNACARRDFEKADRELNHLYKQLMATLKPSNQEKLRVEQRAWLKERDPKCRAVADDEAKGGSMWPMLFQICLAGATQIRIQELHRW